jgi:hypothetical protein
MPHFERFTSSTSKPTVEYGSVFELEDGRIIRMRIYGDAKEALEAVGLRE